MENQEPVLEQQQQQLEPQSPVQQELPQLDPNVLGELQNFYVEYQQQKAISTLRQAWGNNFDEVYAQVESYLSELPEELASQFNNVSGALVLGRLLAGTPIPGLEQNNPAVGGSTMVQSKFKFTKSELDELYQKDRKKYNSMRREIDEAYAMGLVDRNN